MQFLNPAFLLALLLLIIPILIHLFYFRRYKKVVFTNVNFLAELKEEKSVRDKLKRLLILLSRLLALAFLILAFARPFFPGEDQDSSGTEVVSIYLDNSYSMNSYGLEASLFEEAKRLSEKIIESYPAETKFQVLPNSSSAQYQRLISQADAIETLNEIEIGSEVLKLSEVQNLQDQTLSQSDATYRRLYYISDFQKSITDLKESRDSMSSSYLIPLSAEQSGNVSIDSIWLESPTVQFRQSNKLFVTLTNHGERDVTDARLSITTGNSTKPAGALQVPAKSSIRDTITIFPEKGGWQDARITISDFPIQFDNSFFLAYEVPEKLKVLSISNPGDRSSFSGNIRSLNFLDIDSENVGQLNYASFSNYDLILLDDVQNFNSGIIQELDEYVEGGGKLLIFPPSEANIDNYNLLFSQLRVNPIVEKKEGDFEVYRLNENAFVFRNVYEDTDSRLSLPSADLYYTFRQRSALPFESLLSFRNGDPYLQQFRSGGGYVYLSASPLDLSQNNLLQRGDIFAPMLYRMALQQSANKRLSYTIGKQNIIEVPRPTRQISDQTVNLSGPQDFIPPQQTRRSQFILDIYGQASEAGVYDVMLHDSLLQKIAFNYNRLESKLDLYTEDELAQKYPESGIINSANQSQIQNYLTTATLGRELWWYCILFALGFLALEQIFIRFLRND